MRTVYISERVTSFTNDALSGPVEVAQRPDADAPQQADGTGRRLWPTSLVLSRYLCEHPHLIAGKRVVELGCGAGAVGRLEWAFFSCGSSRAAVCVDQNRCGLHTARLPPRPEHTVQRTVAPRRRADGSTARQVERMAPAETDARRAALARRDVAVDTPGPGGRDPTLGARSYKRNLDGTIT